MSPDESLMRNDAGDYTSWTLLRVLLKDPSLQVWTGQLLNH